MKRHTTGIDPYTGIDHGKDEFPEEHRYDPDTGLPIFTRYIAGTKTIIPWPWQAKDEAKSSEGETNNSPSTNPQVQSRDWSGMSKIDRRRAITAEKKRLDEAEALWLQTQPTEDTLTATEPEEENAQPYLKTHEVFLRPDSDDDTGRNLAEVHEGTRSFYPTLVEPPFPKQLTAELAEDIRQKAISDAKEEKKSSAERRADTQARKEERKRKMMERLEVMKTPMQLRWEVEHARKKREEKPLVEMDALMVALGRHMMDKGIRLPKQMARDANEGEREVHVD
jgi:large subunit ribosomal protein L24